MPYYGCNVELCICHYCGCSVDPLCCNCVQYGCCLAAIIWLLCAVVQLPYYGAMWLQCGCHTKAYQGGWVLGDRGTGGPRKVRFSPNGRVPNMGLGLERLQQKASFFQRDFCCLPYILWLHSCNCHTMAAAIGRTAMEAI